MALMVAAAEREKAARVATAMVDTEVVAVKVDRERVVYRGEAKTVALKVGAWEE